MQTVPVSTVIMRSALRLALTGLLLSPVATLQADAEKQPKWDVTRPD